MIELDFAIIGAQKAASTTIQHYLNSHSKVVLPLGEFAIFESPDFEQGRVDRELDDRFVHNEKLVGLKRPNILGDLRAISRLFQHSPNCKVIVVLRDPVDRFVSAYFHVVNSGKLPVKNINTAVEEIFYGNYLDKHPAGISLLHYGLYFDSLFFAESLAQPNSLFLTNQNRIRSNTVAELKRVSDFLGITYESFSKSERVKNRGSYDYRKAIFLNAGNRIRYKFNSGRTRKEYRGNRLLWLVGSAVTRIGSLPLFNSPLNPKDVLNDRSIQLLRQYYETDRQKMLEIYPEMVYW
ncbi:MULTISPECIES: sulfotransferase domain-containing protein [Idiomarina]|uniref:sulfotransferase domain-containing protein n=1 Tax=Idiomarina TaxID=135575 RepID=UPI00129C5BC1|nr:MULTISPECIES: sulfotransferase domain-containing protein [Idiomarina]MRJ42984.1 hypothetical protein [Idiomarina sp. FeN1]NCU58536.1 hypothetical protein [Idiomarina sp. FenA--70]NCU61233.1 hypothetical protein [Idiomarina sp. FenBw--71]UUN12732.1 sulfotransferase domain-containing protein [Idiomarina loihiensis]